MAESKEQCVPKLRFPGFGGEWEKYKLEDIANRYDNLRVPVAASKRIPGNTPYYGANGIQDYVEGYTHNGEYVLIAEDGASDLRNYPVRFVTGKIWVNNHAHVLKGKNNIADSLFLTYALKQLNYEPYVVGGSRSKLNAGTMMKIRILIPAFEEQEQIGNFFKALDDEIQTTKEKIEQLTRLKRGLLQQLFPQKGEDRPRLRFPGFSDAWEQRRLEDVAERYDNLRIPVAANKRVKGDTPYYGANGIQDCVEGYTHDGEYVLVAEDGASDFRRYPVRYVSGKIWVNNHAHVLQGNDKNATTLFLTYLLKQLDYEPYIVGGSRAKLNAGTMMGIRLPYPTLPEQHQISSLFQHLGRYITETDQKLHLLNQQKQALLQQLFI